jgi:hypothetical protein
MNTEKSAYRIRKAVKIRQARWAGLGSSCFHAISGMFGLSPSAVSKALEMAGRWFWSRIYPRVSPEGFTVVLVLLEGEMNGHNDSLRRSASREADDYVMNFQAQKSFSSHVSFGLWKGPNKLLCYVALIATLVKTTRSTNLEGKARFPRMEPLLVPYVQIPLFPLQS